MSYVIQNFSKPSQNFVTTPRFKIFLALKFINFFLFFFKFNLSKCDSFYFNSFLFIFFTRGLVDFFYKLTSNLSANYMNKLTLTGTYWNFKLTNKFFHSQSVLKPLMKFNPTFFYNSYFLSIKITNIKLTKTYFKNIFFFFIFFLSETWYQFHTHVCFYLNFFFIRNNFKLYKFYNGYFFKVYNF